MRAIVSVHNKAGVGPFAKGLEELRWEVFSTGGTKKALAHITGGGFEGNIPRVLPRGLGARIIRGSWQVPAIFDLIQKEGRVPQAEMYRVFNMGVGMVVVVSPESGPALLRSLPGAKGIGEVTAVEGVKIT